MQHGDISNEVAPRLVVVFEGLLGLLPDARTRGKEALARKMKRWKAAANTYEINELLAKHIWDTVWRHHYSVDVCTYLGEEMAEAIEERLDAEQLPVGRVFATEPQLLARKIALMPDVAAIFDPSTSHRFTYGSKGRVMSPDSPNLMGTF